MPHSLPDPRPPGRLRPAPLVLALGCALAGLAGHAQGQAQAQVQTEASPPAAAASAARATQAARPPAGAASRPGAAQTVEVTAAKPGDTDAERRNATASRIVIGREELDRMGDGSLAEVLKRLPGVTTSGPPGRGGGPRMRGMGGGYTLILIDGQRMPPGFSLDSVPPEQIERIEVMRAPVAEFSSRAIAGTINVVMRSDFKRRVNETRFGGGVDGNRPQAGGSWTRNGQTDLMGYNLSLNAFQGSRDSEELTTIDGGLDDLGLPVSDQTVRSSSRGTRRGLFANGRLQFRLGTGNTLDLQPFLQVTRGDSRSLTLRDPAANAQPLAYQRAESSGDSDTQMARLNGTWLYTTGSGGRLTAQFGTRLAQNETHSDRLETGGTASLLAAGARHKLDDARNRELGLDFKGKFSQLVADSHSMVLGAELEHARRNDWRRVLVNNAIELPQFGETVEAKVQRLALFAQDEWSWSKQLSLSLGARYEAILTTGESATGQINNRSGVLTPLAHLVWRLPNSPRDQVRASLTRSYRSPNTSQLVARPSTSSLYPDLSRTNAPTSPDRAGNPALKPELSWGLELGFEHYIEGGGLLSANAYYKRIDDLIRNTRALQTVVYASAPRWVSRPENVGRADAAGLELEAKARASDLWDTRLPLSLRTNLSLMWSKVSQIAGPNNRIEGQPPYTLNLGGDLPLSGLPVTLGADLNFTPGFEVQQIDQQSYRQGRKAQLDAYATWRASPDLSLRLSLNNLLAKRYAEGRSTFNPDGSVYQTSDTSSRSYRNINLRAELRF